LPIGIEKAWAFFSSPANLKEITPPEMGFNITSKVPDKMYPGMIITYDVKVLAGFKVKWMTEITQINEPYYFIDEQRAGPYKIWHHEHHFREIEGGIEMEDIIYYALPFGFIGDLVHPLIVRPQLEKIFDYREKKMIGF
jgi:ligand-binding SRPBCC domain-containing protein